eukprot:372383-Amphidinium_carterae.1
MRLILLPGLVVTVAVAVVVVADVVVVVVVVVRCCCWLAVSFGYFTEVLGGFLPDGESFFESLGGTLGDFMCCVEAALSHHYFASIFCRWSAGAFEHHHE